MSYHWLETRAEKWPRFSALCSKQKTDLFLEQQMHRAHFAQNILDFFAF
jgi:hypothetical protein